MRRLIQDLEELCQARTKVGAIARGALFEPQTERLRRLEDSGVIGEQTEEQAHQQQFQRMSGIAARLEQIVQVAHLLGRLDVDRVLRAYLLRAIAGDEAEVPHVLVQLVQPKLDVEIALQVVQPEPREVGNQDVPRQVAIGQRVEIVRGLREGAIEVLPLALVLDQQDALPEAVDPPGLQVFTRTCDVNLPLEHSDPFAIHAEDREEAIPKALRFGPLRALALPLAGEGQRPILDLVPGKWHVRLRRVR